MAMPLSRPAIRPSFVVTSFVLATVLAAACGPLDGGAPPARNRGPVIDTSPVVEGARSALSISGGLATDVLRDLRIYISFEANSGYQNDPQAQADFRKAAMMGMAMWESVLPAMHVTWVKSAAEANLTFRVGIFGPTPRCAWAGVNPEGYSWQPGHDAAWVGCSFYPSQWQTTGNEIMFSTYGRAGELAFDQFTFVSRTDLWGSYEPATYPPVGYGDPNLGAGFGYTDGRYKSYAGRQDATPLVAHEFGHTLGLNHDVVADKLLAFYGIPHPAGQTRTTANRVTPNQGAYVTPSTAGLANEYYGGGTPSAPWVGDMRLGQIPMHFMATTFDGDGPKGIPDPSPHLFNHRVLNDEGFKWLLAQVPAYETQAEYPQLRGLVQLQRPSDGARALTSNWQQAVSLAQLNTPQSNPYFVTGVFNDDQLQKIAIGANHVLAIQKDGSLWSWGQNDMGQLGDATKTAHTTPAMVSPGPTWISVAAGNKASYALRSDGSLWVWGDRSWGQLGDGTTSTTPVLVAKRIGGYDWAAIKAGDTHAVALKKDGTIWTWGYGAYGQLGNCDTAGSSVPVQECSHDNRWVSIGAGDYHSTALKEDGSLYAWGWNDYGQLGNGGTWATISPSPEALSSKEWTRVDGGFNFTAALRKDGGLWTAGRNDFGQLGAPLSTLQSNSFGQFVSGKHWISVTAGHDHVMALNSDGTLWSWGSNAFGQLGTGAATTTFGPTPAQESTKSKSWQTIVARQQLSMALKEDGSLYVWGDNGAGQFGTGTTTSSKTPTKSRWTYTPPTCVVTAPKYTDKFSAKGTATATITLKASASGGASRVEFWKDGAKLADGTGTGPYTYTWSGVRRGQYEIACKAFNGVGQGTLSQSVTVNVDSLSGGYSTLSTTSPTIDLTTDGPIDWLHAGLKDAHSVTRKKSSAGDIHYFDTANESEMARDTNALGVTWSNGDPYLTPASGTPVTVSPTKNGVRIATAVQSEGYMLGAGADSTRERTLSVYLKNTNADIQVDALINNLTYRSTWSNTTTTAAYRVYKIVFQPGTSTPTLFFTAVMNGTNGTLRSGANIGFLGATLK
jgi:alpha-tubulin suppressor-like RCC1 family protein